MIEEQPLHPLRSFFSDFKVVWGIQVDQRKGFDRALHVKAVAVNHLNTFNASLFCAAGVQLNAVAQDSFVRSDLSKRCTITKTRIESGALFVWECQESPNPLRFWQWQRIKAKTLSPSKTHGNLQFVNLRRAEPRFGNKFAALVRSGYS